MRKLKLQVQMTVDGFIAGVNGEMDFMVLHWDNKLIDYIKRITDPVDCIVLGRKLAEGFIPYWKKVAGDENHPEVEAGRKFMTTPKVVFTKSLAESKWENTVLAKSDISDEINKLKRQNGNDIIAYGGATFVSSLIKNGLVDEYHLLINPTAIGTGMSIFKEAGKIQNLALIKAAAFDCGIVVLNYEPKGI